MNNDYLLSTKSLINRMLNTTVAFMLFVLLSCISFYSLADSAKAIIAEADVVTKIEEHLGITFSEEFDVVEDQYAYDYMNLFRDMKVEDHPDEDERFHVLRVHREPDSLPQFGYTCRPIDEGDILLYAVGAGTAYFYFDASATDANTQRHNMQELLTYARGHGKKDGDWHPRTRIELTFLSMCRIKKLHEELRKEFGLEAHRYLYLRSDRVLSMVPIYVDELFPVDDATMATLAAQRKENQYLASITNKKPSNLDARFFYFAKHYANICSSLVGRTRTVKARLKQTVTDGWGNDDVDYLSKDYKVESEFYPYAQKMHDRHVGYQNLHNLYSEPKKNNEIKKFINKYGCKSSAVQNFRTALLKHSMSRGNH